MTLSGWHDRVWTWRRSLRLPLFAALGVFTALGQAPIDLVVCAWLGWAAALALFVSAPSAKALGIGTLIFGLGYFGFTLRWLVEPFLVDAATWGWAAPFGVSLMALRETLFWVVGGLVARWIAPHRLLSFVLALTLAEALRGYLFTGFPWGLIGHALIPSPLVQLAAFGGPHLLTLVLLGWSAGVSVLFMRRRWIGLVPTLAVGAALPLLAPGPARAPAPDAPVIRIVQPNAPQDEKWDPERNAVFFWRMVDFTSAAPRPDLTVWPETAIPVRLDYAQAELDVVSDAADGTPLVTGINRILDGEYFNSLIVLGRGGQVQDIYDKAHLVPFGEYVPFGDLLKSMGVQGLAPSDGGGFAKGPRGRGLIELPGIGLARALICYEGIFAEEIALDGPRPRLLMMITNDAWFGTASGPQQHLAQARLRSVEQGLPMVRSANTGISAMIDARGRLIETIPLGQAGAIDVALPQALPPTLYSRFGDWPALIIVVLGLVALTATGPRGRALRLDRSGGTT